MPDTDKNKDANPIRILLVEDNPLDAELFREFLADTSPQMAYEFEHADRLGHAVEHLKNNDTDVVFLDFLLPDSDGFKSLSSIKANFPQIPVIMLTGLDDDSAGLKAIQEGAQDYLVKGQVDERTIWRILRYAIERKRIEEKIQEQGRLDVRVQQAQRAESLAVLAGGIAHDYNNLLTGILGNAGLALAELPIDSPTRSLVEEIQVAAARAGQLTRQMLAYSGKHAFEVRDVSLQYLIKEMTPLLDAAASRNAVVRYRLKDDLLPVAADAAQLQQILISLVTNASEAIGDEDGLITIATEEVDVDDPADFDTAYMQQELVAGKYASIKVRDTGCGMNVDTLEKIFDPFFTTKFTGRGLGLASVLGIVRGHQGVVLVTSEPGKGTTFEVLLRLVEKKGKSQPEHTGHLPGDWHGSGTILVIDSEELILSIMKKILSNAGFKVLTAYDGDEGTKVFREHADEIRAVVIDATLPRLNAAETVRACKAKKASVKTVLCTGYSDEESSHRYKDIPVDGFLQKPFLPKALTDCIGELLS